MFISGRYVWFIFSARSICQLDLIYFRLGISRRCGPDREHLDGPRLHPFRESDERP